jgi:chromosome segregation ATPase
VHRWGDGPIPDAGRTTAQPPELEHFERLEQLVRALVDRHRVLERECSHLRRKLAAREARLHELDGDVRQLNQRRQDAVKRIDELVAQLDRLEERLAPQEASARAGGRDG